MSENRPNFFDGLTKYWSIILFIGTVTVGVGMYISDSNSVKARLGVLEGKYETLYVKVETSNKEIAEKLTNLQVSVQKVQTSVEFLIKEKIQ